MERGLLGGLKEGGGGGEGHRRKESSNSRRREFQKMATSKKRGGVSFNGVSTTSEGKGAELEKREKRG